MPEATDLKPEDVQRVAVRGHAVIADVPTDHRAQPCADYRNGVVHASSEFGFHRVQLRLQPIANRLPAYREASIAPLLPANVREAEEVKCLRLFESSRRPVLGRIRAEFQQARFLGMQCQVKRPKPFGEFDPEPLGIRLDLESHHDVVDKTHDDDVAVRALLTPGLDPQVKHVVEVDVRQQGRRAAALRRPLLHPCSLPVLQYAGVQPFLDEPHGASVRDAVLDELHEPAVVERVEESTDVDIEHPVHLLRQQPRVERVQRVVLAASRPEPVREAEEVRFVDGVEHLDGGALNDFVFQRGSTERSLPPVFLRDVHPPNRLRSVRPAFQPFGQVLEMVFQCLAE